MFRSVSPSTAIIHKGRCRIVCATHRRGGARIGRLCRCGWCYRGGRPVRGVDIWTAPTLAKGDGWIATMRHLAREGRCYVVGANPCLHVDQIPADFPHRDRVWNVKEDDDDSRWVEPGNSVIVDPSGTILAGPAHHEETIPYADIDPATVRSFRRFFDPVGHYNRPDVFQLTVDIRPRPAVVTREDSPSTGAPVEPKPAAQMS